MCQILLSGFLIFVSAVSHAAEAKDPKVLIELMTQNVGSYERLKSRRDVEYTYVQKDLKSGKKDVSVERYLFDGEMSWAEYKEHTLNVLPDQPGVVVQGWDGIEAWIKLDGQPVEDENAVALTRFLRRTNFYWFAMMQKLLDPGVEYAYKGTRSEKGVLYDLVEISFGVGIGDASDKYLLYVNPDTKLIDRFLFTVMSFNMTEPFMMEVEYEVVDGIKLPTKRRYTKSNWDGKILDENWAEELSTNIRFKNGFSKDIFKK